MQTQHTDSENLPFSVAALRRQLAQFDEIAESTGATEEAPMLTKIVRLSLDGLVTQMENANRWLFEFMESFEEESKVEEALELTGALLLICQPLREHQDKSPKDLRKLLATFNDRLDALMGGDGGAQGEEETSNTNGSGS